MSRPPLCTNPAPPPHPDYAQAAVLRPRLEHARLELRALFRALDQLHVAQDLPDEVHDLFELDADYAEALCVLDQPARALNWAAMRRDTLASLADLDAACSSFLDLLAPAIRRQLTAQVHMVRSTLRPEDAYLQIPGRDPHAG